NTEAARWHAQATPHLTGAEKIHHTRQAARCYHAADRTLEAAQQYQLLASLVDDEEERFDFEVLATVMMLQCGHYGLVAGTLNAFAKKLGLPRPKPQWLAQISIVVGVIRLKMQRGSMIDLVRSSPTSSVPPSPDETNAKLRKKIDLCTALERPMSLFNNLYATELNLTSAMLVRKHGTFEQRLVTAVGESIFGSYEPGRNRDEGLSNLIELLSIANQRGNVKSIGDVWAGLTYSHFLASRWDQMETPLASCVENYRSIEPSCSFEILHVQWTGLWANWNQGRWDQMTSSSDEMFETAVRRNHNFGKQITLTALGGNAWLVRDHDSELDSLRSQLDNSDESSPDDLLGLLDRIGRIYSAIYRGDDRRAWGLHTELQLQTIRLPFAKMQFMRIICQSLGALIGLHCHTTNPSPDWVKRIRRETSKLRSEGIPFSCTLADFYDGMLQWNLARQSGNPSDCEAAVRWLTRAQSDAEEARLRPIQLAAADALAAIATGTPSQLLRNRMIARGVVSPDKLARLYTIVPQ
ncbi:MAG: hypothetical protein WBD31_32490, partial [Rubripirellula sp.]